MRRLLRAAFGVDDTTDAVTAAAQLTAWVRTRRPDLIDLLPVLASALWAAVPETDASRRIDDDQRRTRRAELAISLLATLAEPLLFVVEDVHWIDDGSKDLLDTVVTAATSRPWTVVVTSRPAGPPQTGDVQLGPLITTAAIALARTARGSAPLRNAQLRSLVERAGGNPLHIAELVAAAAERGSDAAADLDLGAPLARIVASRIDTLPTADRMLLRSVSVGGQRIDLELVARALDDPTLVRPMAWRRLRHFVTAADGQVVFRHDLFRESAYLGLAKRRRRDVHARFASLLEDRAEKSALDQLASLVALHHRGAENWQATWAWSRRAARLVESQGAWSDARTLRLHALTAAARLGLAPAERGEALVDLARVDERLDRWDEAVAGYRAARQLMPPEATVGIDLRRAAVRLRQGDFGAARRLVATVRRAGLDDEWSVRAELIAADAHRREGHLRRARTALEPLLEPARRTGDQDLLAHVLIELEIVTSELGDPVHEAYAQECERVLRDLGDDRRLGQLLLGPAWSRFVSGDWNGAADALGEAAAAFERAGSTEGAGWASNNLGELRSDQRRWAEALDALDEADRCWRGSGFALGVPLIASARGRVALRRGDLATARSELDIAAAGFARLNAVGYVVDTDLRLAELDLADGRLDEGDAALDRATARLGDLEDAPLVPLTLARLRAAMTARRDDAASAASSESATSELRRVTSLARERGVLGELLACLETLDHLGLADDGERAEALALCERHGCVSAS